MQIVLATLVEHFSLAPQPNVEIIRGPAQVMTPLIKGKEQHGTQMPLKISLAR